MEKSTLNTSFLMQLENILSFIPSAFYWKDKNHCFLGANEVALKYVGFRSASDLIGKTDYDIWPAEYAKRYIEDDIQVMSSGQMISKEDSYLDLNGYVKYCLVIKAPLYDEGNNIVGVVGNSIDITPQKEKEQLEKNLQLQEKHKYIFAQLEKNLSLIPSSFYWKDRNHRFLGANKVALQYVGFNSVSEVIGKTDYDIWPAEYAERFIQDDLTVLETGHVMNKEDSYIDLDGNLKYCHAIKAPLYDDENNIIGIIGNAIDITAQKEAEALKLENEAYKAISQEQEKFRKIVDQVAHDIRSPLSSVLMLVKSCDAIPEKERIALREASITINDIANHLLSTYGKNPTDQDPSLPSEQGEEMLVSPALLQLLTEKKYQYQKLAVNFDHDFTQRGNFAWIKIDPTAFKRMLSNIINNAVDAFDQKEGDIKVLLDAGFDKVFIRIEDKGKGMSAELVQKIMADVSVTEGKEDGHGLGLTQVRETLKAFNGELKITSQPGVGTQVDLTFPRAQSQSWIAEAIKLNDDDMVVILDDDKSIHLAWDSRFEKSLATSPNLSVKHISMGQEAIRFINDLSPSMKGKVFLLADYELLKQDLTGLDVIRETRIERSILVTSHYANKEVCKDAIKIGTKLLPKQLAYDIPIHITARSDAPVEHGDGQKQVDAVFVDDDESLIYCFTTLTKGKKVDTYRHPELFLDKVAQYPLHTKIFVDQNFDYIDLTGIDILTQLHGMGFQKLHLFSGQRFGAGQVPAYITVIMKTELDSIIAMINSR